MRVLIPVDDLKSGEAVADFICQHNWPSDTIFRVMYVIPWTPSDHERHSSSAIEQFVESERKQGHQVVAFVAEKIRRERNLNKIEEEVLEGHPARRILGSAEGWGADMIVMGSHGRSGLSLFMLGSVSQAVVSHAPCSVTIVRLKSGQG